MKTWSVKLFGIDFDIRQDDDGVFIIPEGIPGGSALKPAWEPIILCRKPLDGTIAQNATKWGVGGINIDACRIGQETRTYRGSGAQPSKLSNHDHGDTGIGYMDGGGKDMEFTATGRFPANLCLSHSPDCKCVGMKKVKSDGHHSYKLPDDGGLLKLGLKNMDDKGNPYADADGMEEVEAWECVEGCPIRLMDEQSGKLTSGVFSTRKSGSVFLAHANNVPVAGCRGGDSGGASRFFYTAKASKRDRDEGCEGLGFEKEIGHNRFDTCEVCGGTILQNPDRPSACRCETPVRKNNVVKGNHHPTVKSTALMRWLTRLVTPPNGLCLDPFAGSGSTGKACMLEGFNFIGIEQDAEYCKIAEARIRYAQNNAGKEPGKKKPTPRKPATPQATEQPAPEKPAPKPSAQVSIFEIDKS